MGLILKRNYCFDVNKGLPHPEWSHCTKMPIPCIELAVGTMFTVAFSNAVQKIVCLISSLVGQRKLLTFPRCGLACGLSSTFLCDINDNYFIKSPRIPQVIRLHLTAQHACVLYWQTDKDRTEARPSLALDAKAWPSRVIVQIVRLLRFQKLFSF